MLLSGKANNNCVIRSDCNVQVVPEALAALEQLHHPIDKQPRYPFVFITNGGGTSEADRANSLQDMLGVSVAEEYVILAHTPMKVRVTLALTQIVLHDTKVCSKVQLHPDSQLQSESHKASTRFSSLLVCTATSMFSCCSRKRVAE